MKIFKENDMDDQIQEVPNEELSAIAKAEQQAQMDKQFRAMCIDFATRVKDVNATSIIDIAKQIGAYISGE